MSRDALRAVKVPERERGGRAGRGSAGSEALGAVAGCRRPAAAHLQCMHVFGDADGGAWITIAIPQASTGSGAMLLNVLPAVLWHVPYRKALSAPAVPCLSWSSRTQVRRGHVHGVLHPHAPRLEPHHCGKQLGGWVGGCCLSCGCKKAAGGVRPTVRRVEAIPPCGKV